MPRRFLTKTHFVSLCLNCFVFLFLVAVAAAAAVIMPAMVIVLSLKY